MVRIHKAIILDKFPLDTSVSVQDSVVYVLSDNDSYVVFTIMVYITVVI